MENKNVFNRIGKSISGYIGSKSKTIHNQKEADERIRILNLKDESLEKFDKKNIIARNELVSDIDKEPKDRKFHNDYGKRSAELNDRDEKYDLLKQDVKNSREFWWDVRQSNFNNPDKLEKTSRFLDKNQTATGVATVGAGTGIVGTGIGVGNKLLSKKDDEPKQTPVESKPEKSYAKDNYRSNQTPEKHPDPTFLEKHGNSLSLAGGAAAAGLGAYALKKYLDKKKAKKNA